MQNKILRYFLASALAVLCTGYAAAQQKFISALNAEQITPQTNSIARGVCKAWVSNIAIHVDCDYQGLSANLTGWDLALRSGTTEAAFCRFTDTGGSSGSLSGGCAPFFWANWLPEKRLSIVLKTANFPDGEIRGRLKPVTIDNDMDGDGRTDPFLYRISSGGYGYMYCSTDGATISHRYDASTYHRPFMADFDGDGLADVADTRIDLTNGALRTDYTRSSDALFVQTPWGNLQLGDQEANADYDGDGKIDIAVFRETDGNWYILRSSDGQMIVDHWGMSGDNAFPGDYDKDGKADLAVVRAENGQLVWYIRRSSDSTYNVFYWGLSTDTVYYRTPIDIDADGANDVLVSRDVDGLRYFYARQSSDGTMFVRQWGLASDAVKLGDFNGDGRTEFAAVRDYGTNLGWHLSPGADGQMTTFFWGVPDDQ